MHPHIVLNISIKCTNNLPAINLHTRIIVSWHVKCLTFLPLCHNFITFYYINIVWNLFPKKWNHWNNFQCCIRAKLIQICISSSHCTSVGNVRSNGCELNHAKIYYSEGSSPCGRNKLKMLRKNGFILGMLTFKTTKLICLTKLVR